MARSFSSELKYKRRRSTACRHTANPEVRTRILSRDNYKCMLCGSTETLTIDHIISIFRGGTDDDTNLQTLCNHCNAGKAP